MQLRFLHSGMNEKDVVLGGLELSSRVLRVSRSETQIRDRHAPTGLGEAGGHV